MIEEQDLQSLVEYSGKDKVLSIYLDTDLAHQSKSASKLKLRDRASDLEEVAPREIRAVQKYLDFEYDWQSRGLAIFASDDSLWRVIPLPIPVRTQAYYIDRPYIRVLTDVMDRFAEYSVALVDRESVRVFSVAWGKLHPETEALGEELKRHKQGGWSSARYQRHEDNLALHNFKQAAEVIQAYLQKAKSERLMLGGSAQVLAQFKELLPRPLRDKLIGEFPVDMEASSSEILSRSLDIAAQVDLAGEERVVAEAITAAAKGGMGVTGPADTLHVLHQGRVRLLLVEEKYHAPGYVCANCGYISGTHNEECPFCKHTELNGTPDVVNLAIHKAVQTGAHVNIVRENEQLTEVGGMAAILRY